MGMLDVLIHKNKEPKVGMEYIYLLDMVWIIDGKGKSKEIEYGSVMTDVVKLENDSFEFTHKESGKKYRTNYGWALCEKTEDNTLKISEYIKSNEKLKKLKNEVSILRDSIIDLDGPGKLK